MGWPNPFLPSYTAGNTPKPPHHTQNRDPNLFPYLSPTKISLHHFNSNSGTHRRGLIASWTALCLFHPSCMGMTIEQAKKLDHFLCSDCSSDDDAKKSPNGFPDSSISEPKVETKRRKR